MNQETGIQTAIHNLLLIYERQGKCYVVRHNSVSGKLERGGYIKQSKLGVPDILCCIRGAFVGLEVKTDKGKQSSNQKIAQGNIEKAGGKYYIVHSVTEADDIVKGLLR